MVEHDRAEELPEDYGHFGVLYKEHSLSTGRLAGVALLGAGVVLVRFFYRIGTEVR